MNIQDLKAGDILLFSPEKGSFISWAITFLTDAPVSHAALYYNVSAQSIIEETPPQVAVNHAVERFKDREIFVRRLNSKVGLSLNPVIENATHYLNNAEPYDDAGLYLVGLILVYRKFTPTSLVQNVVIKILKRLVSAVDQIIQNNKSPGKTPMVCSQFVAQCYSEAGSDYKLKIKGVLQNPSISDITNGSLLDRVIHTIISPANLKAAPQLSLAVHDDKSISDEDLCRELKDAFSASSTLPSPQIISDELIEAVSKFAYAHHLLTNGNSQSVDLLTSLQNLKYNENMFVFPGDLYNRCENVLEVGVIK